MIAATFVDAVTVAALYVAVAATLDKTGAALVVVESVMMPFATNAWIRDASAVFPATVPVTAVGVPEIAVRTNWVVATFVELSPVVGVGATGDEANVFTPDTVSSPVRCTVAVSCANTVDRAPTAGC